VNVNPTIVVLHEHAEVIELIEAPLRDRGLRVLSTLDAFEAAEIVRRLKVDLLVISRGEPMSLDEIADAVVTALSPRRERS
jgi:CheY-like chemotaxis protein